MSEAINAIMEKNLSFAEKNINLAEHHNTKSMNINPTDNSGNYWPIYIPDPCNFYDEISIHHVKLTEMPYLHIVCGIDIHRFSVMYFDKINVLFNK